jgi:beta-fructofuranosidase
LKRNGLIAHWAFDEGEGNTAPDSAAGLHDPVHYIFNEAEFIAARDPEWRKGGIRGGALLFDGYSTWICRDAAKAPKLTHAFTITAWVAPRSFEGGEEGRLSAIVNQHDRERREGFILGLYRHGSWSLQLGIGGEWTELWDGEHPLPAFRWSHLAATFDSRESVMRLYLNGREIAGRSTPSEIMSPCGSDLLIGKNNQSVLLLDSFSLNMFDGLLDELKLYNRALSGEEIILMFEEDVDSHDGVIPELSYDQIRLDRTPLLEDRHRPRYHPSPAAHWMNEPHAPFYYNGKYHLFYQHNPRGPYFHQIHWGHWVSDDLVHWRDLPIALTPEKETDPDGVWSGSAAFDESGKPVLFYTAGDHRYTPNQWVAVARPRLGPESDEDLIFWEKDRKPLVKLESHIRGVMDFRDPYVWQEDGLWYMLVGSSTEERKGTAYGYSSQDMKSWEFKGSFYEADYSLYPYLGPIWELPVLLPLGADAGGAAKHVFLVSPVGPGSDVEIFYWIGSFDREAMRFIPDSAEPQLIDVGDFHFTGPSGMKDPKTGRSLLFNICQGERTDRMNYLSGWAHNAGLPVELFLRDDGRLGIRPIEELRKLRVKLLTSARQETPEAVNIQLAGLKEAMLELLIEFEPGTANRFGLKVRCSPGGEEETLIFYDRLQGEFGVDRSRTTLDPREMCRGVQAGRLDLNGEALKLHVYLDYSIVEAYANELKSVTTRAYPSDTDAFGIQVWGDGTLNIKYLEIWKLKGIYG